MPVLAMEQVSQEASTARLSFPRKAPCSPSTSRLAQLADGAPALEMTACGALDAQVVVANKPEQDMRDSLSGHGLGSGSRVAGDIFVSMLELCLSALSAEQGKKQQAYPGGVQCSSLAALWLLYVCSWKLMVPQDESNGHSGRSSSRDIDRDGSSLLKSTGSVEEEHKERCEANTPHGIQEPSTEVVHKDLTGLLLSAAKEEAGDAKKDVVSEGDPAEDQQEDEVEDDDNEQNGEDEEAGDNNGDKNNGNNDNNEGEEEGEEEEEYVAEDEEDEDEEDEEEAEGARGPPRRKINVNAKAADLGDTEDEDEDDDDDEAEPEPPKKRVKN